jgi:hypothetical protein
LICFRFIYVPSPHTKEVLSTVLLECLLEWNVDRKLSTVTVDNCTTNDAMMRILLEKLEVSSLALGGSLLHMRYVAHILNLVVQDGLAVIGDGIERIRDSVLFWIASPKRSKNLMNQVDTCVFQIPRNWYLIVRLVGTLLI